MTDWWSVNRITWQVADKHICQWHYSERMPSGRSYCFGLFNGFDLYCVAVYGIGVNPYQYSFLRKVTGFDCNQENTSEIKRVARTEPRQNYPITKFISVCNKEMKKLGTRYVFSFSDPDQGHCGTIYKASNFTYLGKTTAERHVIDSSGKKRHRKYYRRYAERNNVSVEKARRELGLSVVVCSPKDRWFLPLYKKDKKRLSWL